MKHILKCARASFDKVWDGHKKFEVRLNDRDYKRGDLLEMYELFEDGKCPTGRVIVAKCGYVMPMSESFGALNPGYVAISLTHTSNLKQKRDDCKRILSTRKPAMVAANV